MNKFLEWMDSKLMSMMSNPRNVTILVLVLLGLVLLSALL